MALADLSNRRRYKGHNLKPIINVMSSQQRSKIAPKQDMLVNYNHLMTKQDIMQLIDFQNLTILRK